MIGANLRCYTKQSNTPEKSPDKEDMHSTDRIIRNLVTSILNEEHGVKDTFTPLSRREPSPEVESQAEKDDNSSKTEKEVAAEGLCSLGKNLPRMSPDTAQDIEEERSEEEDDTLVNLVKTSVAKRLRKRKSIVEIRTNRKEKRVAGIGPSKAWSKVEVRKKKESET